MHSILVSAARAMRLVLPWLAGFAIFSQAYAAPELISPAPPSLSECHGVKDLTFVAHLDDDLLFMNPDIASNIQAGACVQVVYLTASDAGEGEGYMLGRERGVRAAYAYMAKQPDLWKEDTVQVGTYHIARFTLQGNPHVQLWHMRLKDPWLGKGWGSLTPLSRMESVANMTADTLGPYHDVYTRDELVRTLANIITGYNPTTVRHLDDTIAVPYTQLCWRCAGHGHPDHIASARLVREAIAQAPGNYAETGYIDYPSQEHEANLADAEATIKSEIFRRYAWDDYHYCSGQQGCQEPAGPAAAWVKRSYYVSRHDVAPDLFSDSQGGLMLFAAGENNDAVNMWDGRNHRWNTLGGRTAGPLVSFAYPDATAGLFARDTLGGLWVNKQNRDGSWKGWQAMAGLRVTRSPAVAPNGDAAAIAMGNDGLYYWTALKGLDSGWSAWQALPALPHARGNAAIAKTPDNHFVAFAADRAGHVYMSAQRPEPALSWSPWQRVPSPVSDGGLAAIRNSQGQIELYLRDRDSRHLVRIIQPAPQAANKADVAEVRRAAITDLGVSYVGKPAIGLDHDGEVLVAVLERQDGPLWLIDDGQAIQLEAKAASLPAMRSLHGTLYVVARSAGRVQSYQVMARNREGVWATATAIGALPEAGGGPFIGMAANESGMLATSAVSTVAAPAATVQ
ncbi:PIG-L family deacetylase [Bordetella genomosp. 4]|uniref:GlcNAc-PI de-N-acetylase n=1 Tax=Bordetella genomosp. 4 TaxID=463044 RepID=A0A261US84_9BORD|nr:PIG-L family deacetylase [Bordetella genomosp. 4]OZI64749.1 GlcNAc-PI de-N-acetylase [Bordetella genomosp. 4]